MQTIQASEFKAKCLALMDKIASSGETLVVTKNGKPIVEMNPYSGKRVTSPFGLHPDLEIHGDLLAPLDQEDHSLAHKTDTKMLSGSNKFFQISLDSVRI